MGAIATGLEGSTLGRYRIVRQLGSGGMATVYLAHADGPGGFRKRIAIKVLDIARAGDADSAAMFLDEARTAARISHPNVVSVFDMGKEGDVYWIAMEYVHGVPLRELLERASRAERMLPVEMAAYIASEAALGVHAAHELRDDNGEPLGLVHRDVSPHNLIIAFDGLVKVVDFGIAKVGDRSAQTRSGVIKGKFAYLSPEQAALLEVDRRTDIFALGIVLWETLLLKRLFRGSNDAETIQRVLNARIDAPSTVRSDCPGALDDIVLKALDRDPSQRFRDARVLARALQDAARAAPHYGAEALAAFVRELFPVESGPTSQLAEPRNGTVAEPNRDITQTEDERSGTVATAALSLPASARRTSATQRLSESARASVAPSVHARRAFGRAEPPPLQPADIERDRPRRPPRLRRSSAAVWGGAGLVGIAVTLAGLWLQRRFERPPAHGSVDAPAVAASTGFLTIRCSPECSAFVVDGQTFSQSELVRLPVPAGRRQVECVNARERRHIGVAVTAGREMEVNVHFD